MVNVVTNEEAYQTLRQDGLGVGIVAETPTSIASEAQAAHGVKVIEIASTDPHYVGVTNPNLDPRTNPKLAEALKVYAKHYVATQNGIEGEGEDIPTILSRLQGNDENVKKMTILGLQDGNGKIVGVSFVETYPIKDTVDHAGKKIEDGLVHLATYAAVEPPHKKTEVNTAFHAAMVDKIKQIDSDLGMSGKSVLVSEVNSVRGFNGEKLSDKMAAEFEIKTGVPRAYREEYELNQTKEIIPVKGKYGRTHILGLPYTPPNLGGDNTHKIDPDAIHDTAGLANLLRNKDIEEGRGEPLFLTATSPYSPLLNHEDTARIKKFIEHLHLSVAMENHGITDEKLILDALGHPLNKETYGKTIAGLDSAGAELAKSPQPNILRVADWRQGRTDDKTHGK